ncbi:MAG: gliding motility-associated C-terminal domain-containing protein, partial [Bacteroidota bacterium]
DCPGDNDGSLSLSIFNGVVPYQYQWQNTDNSLNGTGMLTIEGGSTSIDNLPQGNYQFTITDAFGETTATAQVIDPQEIVTTLDEVLCFGESFTVGTQVYTTTSIVNETLTSSLGCDSLVTGLITVLPLNETVLEETLCFGESLLVGATTYQASGPINEVLQGANGCDSLVTGQLTILPEISTNLNPTVCAGESVTVGNSTYSSSGNYTDILPAANGCDSIIQTNLTVLGDLQLNINLDFEASALGANDGQATVMVGGGSGNFAYAWSNAQTMAQASGLTGGETYCVTVTDDIGCEAEACIVVLFPVNILTDIQNDTLDCIGNTDGLLQFSISNGQAPYQYVWQNEGNVLNGNGVLMAEGGMASVSNLPSGNYFITVTDPWGMTTLTASVVDPSPIIIEVTDRQAASCFSNCDAAAVLAVSGGQAPYDYAWPDGQNTAAVTNLCAGAYPVTITDALGCIAFRTVTLEEPAEFVATALESEAVTCFGGTDGQAVVSTNGNPIAFLWDNGEINATATQLSAGAHSVTVTNQDNCQAIANVLINQPLASLTLSIDVLSPISCFEASDGVLAANIDGGNGQFGALWSNGISGLQADGLSSGFYELTVTDDKGCTTVSAFDLTAPDSIELDLMVMDVTCPGGNNSGLLRMEEVRGGIGPYLFSLDGNFYTADSIFSRLPAGTYEYHVEDAAGCVQIFPVRIQDPPVLVVSLGLDEPIELGDSIQLQVISTSDNVTYQWTPLFRLDCDTCARVWASPTETVEYTVAVVDTLTGCTASDEILVQVQKNRNVFIPNVFSPNLDGNNDVLMINGGIDVNRVVTFQIFNRWGAKVFERNNFLPNDPSSAWNGTLNGEEVANGVYLYHAQVEFLDGRVLDYSGDITVLR